MLIEWSLINIEVVFVGNNIESWLAGLKLASFFQLRLQQHVAHHAYAQI